MVNVAVAAHAALTAPSAASVSRPLAYLTAPSNTTSATGGGFKAHRSQHTTVPRRPPTAPTPVAVAPVGQLHSMPMYGAQPHWPAPCMPHPNAMMMAQPSLHWPMISVDQSHCEEVLEALRSSNFFVAANDISVFTGAQRLRCAAMPDAAATALRVDADCSEPLSPLPSEYTGSVSAVNLVVAGVPSTMTAHELRRCLMDLGGVSLLAMHPVPVSPYESLMYPHVLGTGASVRWNVTVPTNGVAALVNLHRRLIVQSEQVTLFHSAEAADQWAILRDHCLATVRGLAGMHSDFRAASNALSIEAVHSAAR